MAILFKNNASTKLASGITAAATSMTVLAETGNLFPAPGANEYFLCTLVDDLGNKEIVKVTSRNADVFTIVRAQEGTTAREFNANSLVENRLTAGALNEVLNVTYASDAEVAAGVETTKAISPATVSSANVASAVTAGTCTGNAATATTAATAADMSAGHVLAGATTAAAVLASIAPAVTTPAQFDNSTKLATTAFVRAAAGNLAGFSHVTASTTLTSAHIGTVVNVDNTDVTLTLPDPQPVPYGSTLTIRAGYACTLAAPAGTYIYAGDNTERTTYAMAVGKTCTLFAAGNAWWAYSGSALAVGSGVGSAFYATPGTFTFTVPSGVTSITVYVQGAGGSNGKASGAGNSGGSSSFSVPSVATISATGGAGGTQSNAGGEGVFVAARGGLGSGGNLINAYGGWGMSSPTAVSANNPGGNPVLFGWGGYPSQTHYCTPGVFGGGASYGPLRGQAVTPSGGAAGGFAASTLTVTPGTACTVIVGAGGANPGWDGTVNGAAGGNGYVYITW